MANSVHFRDAYVEVGSTDLSDQIESVALNYASEMLDATAMGANSRIRKGGLKDWSIEVNAHNDFDVSKFDDTLFALVGTTVCIEIRPKNICSTSAAGGNARYSGTVVLESYNPLSGSVGSILDAPATFQSAGDLSRFTSAS